MSYNNPGAFWLLLLLPALFLVSFLLNMKTGRDKSRFASPELYDTLTRSISSEKRTIRKIFFSIGLIFLVFALTGPRFGTKTEIVQRLGVDIIIAIDTSYSMLAEDIKPNRMEQSKYEIHRLIDELTGDRVALIAFSGESIIHCPLTTDYGAAKTFLDYIDVGVVPIPGTNIEKAIHSSFELFEKGSGAGSESQIIILVTDGESIKGKPLNAAERAAEKGIRIFTIGIGTSGGEIIPIRDENGQLEDYKKDSSGNVVKSSLDEKTLEQIAAVTKGSYLRGDRGEVNVQQIIEMLGSLHKTDLHERKISRLKEQYRYPLGLSLMFLLSWFALGERRKEKII
jgi:Ca-activated chloride channel homolog